MMYFLSFTTTSNILMGHPPEDYCFVPCVDFMSSSQTRRMMDWDKSYRMNRSKPAPRPKRSFWAMEAVSPALYDQEPDVDVNSGRRLRSGRIATPHTIRVENPLISKSSSSVETDPPVDITASKGSSVSEPSQVKVPHVAVQREHLRHQIYQKLSSRGLRPVEENVELSDISDSDSSSECS